MIEPVRPTELCAVLWWTEGKACFFSKHPLPQHAGFLSVKRGLTAVGEGHQASNIAGQGRHVSTVKGRTTFRSPLFWCMMAIARCNRGCSLRVQRQRPAHICDHWQYHALCEHVQYPMKFLAAITGTWQYVTVPSVVL